MSDTCIGTVTMVVDDNKTSPDGTYTGRLVNNKRDGCGAYTWPDGRTYNGEWRDGKMHGRGVYAWPNGDTHEGEFHNGTQDGWGVRSYAADGSRYEGLWRAGRWKTGTLHHRNNSNNNNTQGGAAAATETVYEGEWDRDQRHGWGTWRSPDTGDMYHGQWDHGKRAGAGRMLFGDKKGGGSYVGEWEGDMFHGRGVRLWANGDRYEGQWVCGNAHGTGRMTWARDGQSFDGAWEMGVMKSGTMKWPNGDQFTGTFTVSGEGDGTATFKSDVGSRAGVEGTLKNSVFIERGNVGTCHQMGCCDLKVDEVKSLKKELHTTQQKLHEQTQCLEHVLKHIQRGGWMKSISAPSPLMCVMKKVSVTLDRHNITFPESICSLCPLDKVVKMEVEKRFGVDETEEFISFSVLSHSEEGGGESTISPSLSLSQLESLYSFDAAIPEMKVSMAPVLAIDAADLHFLSPLGSGRYGTVVKCTHTPSGREVAVKTMNDVIISERNVSSFRLEAEIVSGLRHPNLAECIGTLTTGTEQLQIVSELLCCSLRQLMKQKKLSIKEVMAISLNVAKGMDCLHRQKIFHRHLSSNNVLFDTNGVPKICDFVSQAMDPQGAASNRAMNQGTDGTIDPGTRVYMAPQMFTARASIKGDMWGFGILVTEMLNGDVVVCPFDSLHEARSQAVFMNEQMRLLASNPQEIEEVSKLCRESSDALIASCLSRRTASIDAVNHLIRSSDTPMLPAALDIVVLVVQSCLSILERNRVPFTMIAKLLWCCCTAIVASSQQTISPTGGTVTDDKVNESITQWLNGLGTSSD